MIRPVAADGRLETGGAFTPIVRPRVVDRISAAAAQRIVLILAPAGYGKSVALRQYLETLRDQHVRYDVRAEHSTLLGFARGFTEALLEVAPDARKTVSNAFEKSRSSTSQGADLAMWLHAHIKTFAGVIAIDDLHVAENDPEISKFLVSLIERTKGRVSWVIASRSSLDLPVGSWLAYGEMDLNIDEQDLRFTTEEARVAAKSSRVGVRDEELAQILAMTEGWPTALSFALRTSTRSVDLRNITATTREMIYRYLAEQVYKSLHDEERELLHFVAFLPDIDIEVLRAAGYASAKSVIEALRDRVAFIYQDTPGIYRCHDLFRDFLQHEAELIGDSQVESYRRRAAAALDAAGKCSAALRLYAQLQSEADILRILEAQGFPLMDQAHADVVHEALNALSPDVRAGNSLVLGLRALGEAEQGRFDRAESLLQRAIARVQNKELAADLSIRLSVILSNLGRDVFELLRPIVEEDLSEDLHGSAMAMVAVGHAYMGRLEEARNAIDATEALALRVESDEIRAKMYLRLGNASTAAQLPQERIAFLMQRGQALAQQTALFSIAAHCLSGLANISLFYEDDGSKCSWYAQQALNSAIKAGDRLALQTALLQMINVEARRGNPERLQSLLAQFASTATTDSARMSYAMPNRAMLAAWEGRFEEAHRLQSLAAPAFFSFDRVFNDAKLALYAVASGRREAGLEHSARVLKEIDSGEFEYLFGQRQAEIARCLCACAEALGGRLSTAGRILQRKPQAEGPSVEAMHAAAMAVWRSIKRPALRDDIRESLEPLHTVGWGGVALALEQAAACCLQEGTTAHPEIILTKAELDVLTRLAEGRSPKDIAEETGRSIYTIQAHVQNVIKKLGCSGRHEALTVARKRGLLA